LFLIVRIRKEHVDKEGGKKKKKKKREKKKRWHKQKWSTVSETTVEKWQTLFTCKETKLTNLSIFATKDGSMAEESLI